MLLSFNVALFVVLIFLFCGRINAFTCEGVSYANALSNCPDKGAQAMSIGGNVSFHVKYATNLPNRDSSGPAAGVSDPYVRFTVGNVVKETSHIRNNLNPVWDEHVSLGFLGSATAITVEIWDKDSGLEFSDDIMVRSTIRVPFCSMFNAPSEEVRCGQPFGCEAQDSSWNMPRRKACNETGSIQFGTRACGLDGSVCLYVTIHIIPFQLRVSVYIYLLHCLSSSHVVFVGNSFTNCV